jgi:hypothetical protein
MKRHIDLSEVWQVAKATPDAYLDMPILPATPSIFDLSSLYFITPFITPRRTSRNGLGRIEACLELAYNTFPTRMKCNINIGSIHRASFPLFPSARNEHTGRMGKWERDSGEGARVGKGSSRHSHYKLATDTK